MSPPLRISIESLSHGGDAVAHAEDGRAVFVRAGCPGDIVDVDIVETHERFLRAVVTDVVQASPDRVQPPCPYFGVCGGCQWQHVAKETQLEAKHRSVSDALQRIGHIDADVRPIVTGPRDLGYRNRVELSVRSTRDSTEVGYTRADNEGLVTVRECLLLPDRQRRAPAALSGVLRYLARGNASTVTRVGLRVGHNTRDVSVDLWTAPGPFPRQLAARAVSQAVGASGVSRVMARPGRHAREIAGVETLGGASVWTERLAGFTYSVSPPSFFQVNTQVTELMVELVLEALSPSPTDTVLDLYAGVGTFTLPIAALGADVIAVEGAGYAVRDLRKNLEDSGLEAVVAPGDAARALGELGSFDLAVVDPPRAGMRPDALAALVESTPKRIVYVSCDPATLARDAARLTSAGYSLRRVTPVDLFPQTYHLESIAVLDSER